MAKALEVRTHVEKELAEAICKEDTGREADCRQAPLSDSTALESGVAQVAHLLRVLTAEVTKRGCARRWVAENTAWDAAAAIKLYRTVAKNSLAHWLNGGGQTDLGLSAGFVREHVLNMVSELHGIASSHAARAGAGAGAKMRVPQMA